MKKTVKGKSYDTIEMSIVKKVTSGAYGDPAGYEETLYVAEDGTYFLYTNGGAESKYTAEKLTQMSKAKVRSVFSCRYRQKYRSIYTQNVIYFAVIGKKMRMTA